jgi:bifunctional enzyme CysN/CysC
LLGVPRFVLAVTKMDLVDYDQAAFDAICADFRLFADSIGITDWHAIPLSGLNGDNVVAASTATHWYPGPSLIELLARTPAIFADDIAKPLRMPVQWVNRPNQDFRGFAGLIASGGVAPGDEVRILPSGESTRIERIVAMDGDLPDAVAGQSVTLTFADDIACSRGDVIVAAAQPLEAADQFETTIVWLSEDALIPGRGYWLKLGTQTVTATVQQPKFKINVNSLERLAAPTLALNSIGVAEIATDRDMVFEPYSVAGSTPNRALGGFIPAATTDPDMSSSTTSAAATPTSSAAPPTSLGGTDACPVTYAVRPESPAA